MKHPQGISTWIQILFIFQVSHDLVPQSNGRKWLKDTYFVESTEIDLLIRLLYIILEFSFLRLRSLVKILLPFKLQFKERDLHHVSLGKLPQIYLVGQESMQGFKNRTENIKDLKRFFPLARKFNLLSFDVILISKNLYKAVF